MANLSSLIRWQPYVPDIGDNVQQKRPFYVEVAVGITKAELLALDKAQEKRPGEDLPEDATEEQKLEAHLVHLSKTLDPFVRMGKESLHVGERHVRTLYDLLKLYSEMAGGEVAMLELASAVGWFNSAGGRTQSFYARLSGGSASILSPPSGKNGSQGAAQ